MGKPDLHAFSCAVLSGALCGAAWMVPGTVLCAALGWLSAALMLYVARASERPYRFVYVSGLVENAAGFYWLTHAISVFGGFGAAPTAAIYVLFVTLSSVQHLVFVFIYRGLPNRIDALLLKGAIAWTMSELCSVRIFPWHWGHTQLAFTWFAQIADIAGSLLVTFVLFWIAESAVAVLITKERRWRAALAPSTIFALALAYGYIAVQRVASSPGPDIDVALVQGNVSLEEKMEPAAFRRNRELYLEMTKRVAAPGKLIVWPETVIMSFVHTEVRHVDEDMRLPLIPGSPLLIGSLTFTTRELTHNSALAISASGEVLPPYHKMILMPFGEFTPLGKYLPWLKEINSTAADFTPGPQVSVFEYSLPDGAKAKVSPLICYEDVTPRLALRATEAGAGLLVNLTNDAWFGESAAPYQHHLIASFRAIENRRYLLRATNSGLTAVVDPLGRTLSRLPIFTAGVLEQKVKQIDYKSVYTEYLGEAPWRLLLLATLVMIALERLRHRRQQRKEKPTP